jgi:hypothetical protein
MKFTFILFIISFCPVLVAQTSYVAPTKILAKKGYQLGVYGDAFVTSKRIDKDGKNVDFEDGEKFSRTQGEVIGYYGLTGNFQVGGGARFRQNNSTNQAPLSTLNENETSTGIESTFLTLTFAFEPINRIQYTLEGLFRYRPYTNDESTPANEAALVLGDQGSEFSGGLGFTYTSKSNNSFAVRVGYRKPGDELSSEIYWQAEGALVFKYVAIVLGVDGVTSMKNDPYEDDPINKAQYYTGSTNLYNSINREFITPYAGLNIALGKTWRVELRGSQVVSARSSDIGTGLGVSLIRRVEDKAGAKVDSKFKEYDFEGTITKISPKKGFVVIDKGMGDDVQKGMKIDFFEFDYVGGNILLARGTVISTKADSSIVKISHLYNNKKELKEGIMARGSFR